MSVRLLVISRMTVVVITNYVELKLKVHLIRPY